MKKILLFMFMVFIAHFAVMSQDAIEVSIGTGTSTSNSTAFIPYYGYSWFEAAYTPEEIGSSGMIQSVSVYMSASSTATLACSSVKIYLGHRSEATYATTNSWTSESDLTLAYSASDVTLGGQTGWVTCNLSEPFVYNGSDNLVIVFSKGSSTYNANISYQYTSVPNSCLYRRADGIQSYADYPGNAAGAISPYRPNVKISIVTSGCPSAKQLQISGITTEQAGVSWFNEDGDNFEWQYKTSAQEWDDIALETTSDDTLTLTGLEPNTLYDFRIRKICEGTESYWSSRSFRTNTIPATVPYICDFQDEDDNLQWLLKTTGTNRFTIGAGTSFDNDGSDMSLYVTNDETGTYAADSVSCLVFAERYIDFGETPASYSISLDWKAAGYVSGNSAHAGIILFVRPADEPTPTEWPSYVDDHIFFDAGMMDWTHAHVQLENISGVKKVQFLTWGLDQPGARDVIPAIDNIVIEETECLTPEMTITPADVTATVTHNGPEDGSYIIYYRPYGTPSSNNVYVNFEGTEYTIEDLQPSTNYYVWIGQICGDDTSAINFASTFKTSCGSVNVTDDMYWLDDFSTSPDCWDLESGSSSCTYDSENGYIGHSYGFYNADAITPPMNISEVTTPWLKFSHRHSDYNGSGLSDSLEVYCTSYPVSSDSEWILLFSNSSVVSSWRVDSVALPEGMSGMVVKFHLAGSGSSANGMFIDNVKIYNETNPPTCSTPLNLATSDISDNSVKLSWNLASETGLGSLNLSYKKASDSAYTVVTGVELDENGVYLLEGLSPITNYIWFVTSVCEDGSTMSSFESTFKTLCDMVSQLPYYENFDNVTTYSIPECWSVMNPSSDGAPYVFSYNAMSGNSMEFQNYAGAGTFAVLPEFEEDLSQLQISFYTRREDASSGTMRVGYLTDPASVSSFVPLWSITSSEIGDNNYHKYIVQFADYDSVEGISPRIAFNYQTNGYHYWYVDEVTVNYIPSCLEPVQLAVSNITTNSAKLSWVSDAADYNIYYKIASDSVYEMLSNVTLEDDNTYMLENLEAGNRYIWYVEAVCEDETTVQSETSTFITDCLPFATLPQSWDFEAPNNGGTSDKPLPICWRRGTTSDGYPYVYGYYSHGGSNSLYIANNGTGILPAFDSEELQVQGMQLSFYARTYSSSDIPLKIGVMTDPAIEDSFVEVASVSVNSSYALYEVYFTEYEGEGNYIAFRSASILSVYVDDVVLDVMPACPKVQNLSVTDVTENSATVSWTGFSETSYEVKYKEVNSETWNEATSQSESIELTGLTHTTTYEVAVAPVCDGDVDFVSATFSTQMAAANLPYSTDFASSTDWKLNNNTATNYWTAGVPSGETGSALFITNNGTSAGYTISSASTVTAEKLFNMPASSTVHVEFDVKVGGEITTSSAFDYLKVFLTDHNTVFGSTQSAASYSNGALNFSEYASQTTSGTQFPYVIALTNNNTVHVSMNVANPAPDGIAKLAFLWRNDVSYGTQPGAIVSNFSISEGSGTPVVVNPTVTTNDAQGMTQTSATLYGEITNAGNQTITARGFEWKAVAGGTVATVNAAGTTTFSANLTGLTAATEYTFRAFATTANGNSYGEWKNFTTLNENQEPCNAPSNVTVTDFGKKSITITWDANGASKWAAQYRKQGSTAWTMGSNNITSPTYTFSGLEEATVYEYQVQAVCDGTTSAWSQTGSHSTGIDSRLMNSVSLYPNPATNHVDVLVGDNSSTVSRLEVYDAYGKLISEVEVVENPTRINVSSLQSGMYFVKVVTENGTATKRFVKN